VDTGINDVFVATDGINDEPHRYRKLVIKWVLPLSPLDNDVEDEYQHYSIAFWQNQLLICEAKKPSLVKQIFKH
jgi:hypothetical protein